MANSLQPWICDYIIQTAETHGANMSNIPSYHRQKKLQITKFLTYGSENETTAIWAEGSDAQYLIPLKLTKEALTEYNESFIFGGQRITQQSGAIITIKGFKPILTRVPQNTRLSSDPSLVLECTSFKVLGSSGEATFGNPMPITQCADIQLWAEGLKSDGGAGNVLKERKIQRDSKHVANEAATPSHSLPPAVQQGPLLDADKPQIRIHITRDKVRDLATYNARWQYIAKDSHFRFSNGEEPVLEGGETRFEITTPDRGLEMDANDVNAPRSRSGTPLSAWDPTPSKRGQSPTEEDLASVSQMNYYASSSLPSFPTPAQRVKNSIAKQNPDVHSSFPSGNETVLESGSPRQNMVVPRKIPRPTSPVPARRTGPARILAPNSDTSGTQSQSQGSQEERRAKRRLVGMEMEEAGEYPWIDLWGIRDMMERMIEGRRELSQKQHIT